jgi:hypothetical protein
MTERHEWHADERLLAGYVTGALALPAAMSLEQHVMHCGRCRDALAGQLDPRPLDRVWHGIESRVEGSLRQRWRRWLFRARTRPVRRPLWAGALAGLAAALSAGYLAIGAVSLGSVRVGEPQRLVQYGVSQADLWRADLGPGGRPPAGLPLPS